MRFENRSDAGRRLAELLREMAGDDVVVLGLPRGGVPAADEVATALGAPLDVIVVRKLGVPSQPELAMGAIGEDGARVVNHDVVALTRVSPAEFAAVERRERAELERRVRRLRGDRARLELSGRTALVVDDGIATGSTARAACQVARQLGAATVVIAAPVAPRDAADRLAASADRLVVVHAPAHFFGVGQFYADFTPTTDEEVLALLREAAERRPGRAAE